MDTSIFGTPETRMVLLREINPDLGVQYREGINAETVEEYAESYRLGKQLRAIVLFHDGQVYFRADGAHRILGAKAAGLPELPAEVYQGGLREARIFAAGCNADFGLRRSKTAVNNSILALLRDPQWYLESDNAIAEHVNCAPTTVAKRRAEVDAERAGETAAAPVQADLFAAADDAPASHELHVERDPDAEPSEAAQTPAPRPRKGKDGRTIDTSKIGKASQAKADERVRKILAAAEEVGRGDAGAGKAQRNQGALLVALRDHVTGKLPPGMLKTVYAAYVSALEGEQVRLAAEPKEEGYKPILGGPTADPLRGLPPRRASVIMAPPAKDQAADAPALEPLDMTPLHEVVDRLASDPARKLEVGQELLRLAGELGAVQVGEIARDEAERLRKELSASLIECKRLRETIIQAAEQKRLETKAKKDAATAKPKKGGEAKGKESVHVATTAGPERPRPVADVLGKKAAGDAANWEAWGKLQAPTAKTPAGRRNDAQWLIVNALSDLDLNADELRPSELKAAMKGLEAVLTAGAKQAEPGKGRGGKSEKVAHG